MLFNTEDKIVDNMHRKLNCIFNDIRELSQNQFLANKILKYQQIFNNPMPLPKIFKVIDETCSKIMMSEHSVLILLDDYQKELFTMRHKDKEIRFEMDKGYLGKVFNEGLNIVIDQMEEDNEINKHICVKLGIIPKCILINPIYNSSNIIAAVVFINKKSNPKNTNNHKIRFDSNDEIVGNILSKQISSFLRISCFKTEFSEKEYKLKKAMGLVYKVTSLHKSFSVSIFISEIKKLFLTNHVQLIVIPDNDKDDKHRNKDTRKEDKSAFNNSGIIMSSTNYKKASIIENNLRGPKKILKINMDNESEITELTGLIAYVYKTKNSLYVVNRQNNTKYNPHFDIDTTSPIITYPIIINKIEKKPRNCSRGI